MNADDIAPALLSEAQAAAFYGVSPRTFHELRSQPWMPAPIQLGVRLQKWSRHELEGAVAAMPRTTATAEPLHLAKSRAARAGTTEVGDLATRAAR